MMKTYSIFSSSLDACTIRIVKLIIVERLKDGYRLNYGKKASASHWKQFYFFF
jgi:hypothetical protein